MSNNNLSSDTLLLHPKNVRNSYDVKPTQLIQYPENVKKPSKEIRNNIYDGIEYSLGYMGSGVEMKNGKDRSLGANYFINTNKKCDSESSSAICKDKDRYVYVRNIPTGTIPPLNLSFYNATGCNLTGLTEGRGLVPGLVEDIYDFNPIELAIAASGNGNLGSDSCKEMTLPIGSQIYNTDKENQTWKWESKCTSGFHTMTETTNDELNRKVRNYNPNIKRARLPGPLQLRENFKSSTTEAPSVAFARIIIISAAILALLRSLK